MLEQVKATIQNYNMYEPGDRILAGVSGGPDSVAMMHVLCRLSEELEIKVCAAHLNHGFRGRESAEDAVFVTKLAEEFGLEYMVQEADVPSYALEHKMSPQAAAREVRYRFFESAAKKLNCNKVATAHNANDQAETILHNFLRGSGPRGLAGIRPVRDRWITRPLIEVRRSSVEEYILQNSLKTRIDKSNLKKVYTRNKIRLELIPLLVKEYNANMVETLIRTGEIFREEEKFIREHIRNHWKQVCQSVSHEEIVLDLKKFVDLPGVIQKGIIRHGWSKLACTSSDLGFSHLDHSIDLLLKGETGSAINLPKDIVLEKSYDYFRIFLGQSVHELPGFSYKLEIPGVTRIPEIGKVIIAEIIEDISRLPANTGSQEILIDLDAVKGPLTVRTREPGDRFKPVGTEGSKKLKKYLIDSKIPRRERDILPVVVDSDNQVIWVAGLRADRRWKPGPETRRPAVLKLVTNI